MLIRRSFIPKAVLKKLEKSSTDQPVKLLAFIKAINLNYNKKEYFVVIILTRAAMDYIPSIFGYENVATLHSQYPKKQTFKNALKLTDDSTRLLADDLLHNQAHKNEILKGDKPSCDNIRENFILIMDEVANQLTTKDLRELQTGRPKTKKQASKKTKTQLEQFDEYMQSKDNWSREFFDSDDKELWICRKDELYQIHILNDHEDFSEPWTQVYPDSGGSGSYHVNLVYNNNLIKQFKFIYCDGGRIRVVMPETELDPEKNYWEGKDIYGGSYKDVNYYWKKDSMEFMLMNVIGNFYIYKDSTGIASRSKIDIR